MRVSLELIGVSLVIGGGLIRIRCVAFNFRLMITLRRLPALSTSSPDFARPQSNEVSAEKDAPPRLTSDLLIVVAQPPGSTSH